MTPARPGAALRRRGGSGEAGRAALPAWPQYTQHAAPAPAWSESTETNSAARLEPYPAPVSQGLAALQDRLSDQAGLLVYDKVFDGRTEPEFGIRDKRYDVDSHGSMYCIALQKYIIESKNRVSSLY